MLANVSPTGELATVLGALKRASAATGSDFSYLLSTATRESSLKADAKASGSSAAGLFQFVEQTWLGLVKEHGEKHGLTSFAAAISKGPDGRYHVDSEADRHAVLALRSNPDICALMAGEYAQQTRSVLENNLGRSVSNGELYAAHFLGPDAACRLIRMNQTQPGISAAEAFPQAASANKSAFYHADGGARSVRELCDWMLKGPAAAVPAHAMAAANTPQRPAALQAYGVVDIDPLLANIGGWSPSRLNFLGGGMLPASATSPLALNSGLMELLASMGPRKPGDDVL